ncbi:MAG: exodeoxyribonuclease VII small subunit [Bacteroidales bacterium]|nr:exodeoxyribonuclease VII small subunit [Bacteroidales bacterium]
MDENKTYETALAELESLVQRVEDPDRSFSSMMADLRRGRDLVAYCREQLRKQEEDLL